LDDIKYDLEKRGLLFNIQEMDFRILLSINTIGSGNNYSK